MAAAAITTQRNVSHVRKNQNQDQKILNLNGNRKRKKRKVDGGKKNNKQHNRWFARISFFFKSRKNFLFFYTIFCAFVNNDHKLATKRHNQYIYSKHTFIRSFSSLDIQYWHSPEEILLAIIRIVMFKLILLFVYTTLVVGFVFVFGICMRDILFIYYLNRRTVVVTR